MVCVNYSEQAKWNEELRRRVQTPRDSKQIPTGAGRLVRLILETK